LFLLLASKDAGFRRFALRHVDATFAPEDLQKIRARAKTACPAELARLCDDLGKRAGAALKEAAEYEKKQ